MRSAKSAHSNRLAKSPAETQSPLYQTRREKVIKSPGLVKTLNDRRKYARQVSPENAAEVIKHYIIPLFEHKVKKSVKGKLRQDSEGSSFSLAGSKNPIAEELVLSSKLYEKLKRSEESRIKLENKCSQFEQDMENGVEEEKMFEALYLDSLSTVKALALENFALEKRVERIVFEKQDADRQQEFYKGKYEEAATREKDLRAEVESARDRLDIRFYFAVFFN